MSALESVVARMGGLGGLVHEYVPGSGLLRLVAAGGLTPETIEAWTELRVDQDLAPARAVREGALVRVAGERLPGGEVCDMAAVPLSGFAGPIGALSLFTGTPVEPDTEQHSLLLKLAAWLTGYLDASREMRAPQLAVAWTDVMGRMTAALTEAVTSADIVRTVADHLRPVFGADGVSIEVLESGRLHVVGNVGYPPDYLRSIGPLKVDSLPTVAEILRTRAPSFIESADEFAGLWPQYKDILDKSPMKSWAFLPLTTSGRAIGVCVISYRRPHVFSSDERTLMAASSGVVAQALERARLYDVEHARAQGLQRALLPKTLPTLPAVRAAARYLPVSREEEVGGDWYDIIPLSADRVAMVIGDVMGHGITEAATMGRLRTAVRTLAELEMPPDELFGHLNELVDDLAEDCFATCLYAVFDPVAQTCTICSAGHPPPAVVHPDGTVHYPALDPDPPLGAANPPFTTHELRLPGEHTLVFCTDGLLEAATNDVEEGMAQLRRTLADTMADGVTPLDELCDTIVSALMPDREHTSDDAAVLIARTRCTTDDDVASFDLPDDPRAAGQARRHVREQLATWGLDDLTMTTELVVSELVGNVVRHAKGPSRLRLLRSRSLVCEVYDGSLSTPRIRRAEYTDEGGRGLHLVSELSHRWGARYLAEGKCIWAEQSLTSRDDRSRSSDDARPDAGEAPSWIAP
ncbi:SpoIIE family protein phosphatase [Streptomyces sp. NPDC057257]|uniref:ATP-binding SpoIIE family protein phosphatase n=1 Tax=Streptomyces sp. NPDC057257 TaxID=3346071 RepID=UPI003634FDA6